jgi:hypothetical protein
LVEGRASDDKGRAWGAAVYAAAAESA